MNMVNHLGAAMAGFFIGLLVWNRSIMWGYSTWVAVQERRKSSAGGALSSATFLHSGPWLLALAIFLTIHIISAPHDPEWVWFFSGAIAVLPVIALLVLRVVRRQRLRRQPQPAVPAEVVAPRRPG